MFDTITSMPFMYDERLYAVDHLQLSAPFPVFLIKGRAKTNPSKRTLVDEELRYARKKANRNRKSHINTLWDCYREQ